MSVCACYEVFDLIISIVQSCPPAVPATANETQGAHPSRQGSQQGPQRHRAPLVPTQGFQGALPQTRPKLLFSACIAAVIYSM
jgi:hypothetical protein